MSHLNGGRPRMDALARGTLIVLGFGAAFVVAMWIVVDRTVR